MNYQKYIENMKAYDALNHIDLTGIEDETELVDTLISISNQKRTIQLDNNRILQECIVPFEKDPSLVTHEISEELRRFWACLRTDDNTKYYDRGVSLRINRILKQYYTTLGDWEGVLRQDFLIAYFENILTDHDPSTVFLPDYSSAEIMKEKFDSFSPAGKISYLNYIGSLIYCANHPEGVLDRFTYLDDFIASHGYSAQTPEIKDTNCYYFAMIDTLTHVNQLYKKGWVPSESEKSKILQIYHNLLHDLEDPDHTMQRAVARLNCLLLSFHLGEIPLYQLLAGINRYAKEREILFFADQDSYDFLYPATYMEYLNTYKKGSAAQMQRHYEVILSQVRKTLSTLSKGFDSFYATHYCAEFIKIASECMGYHRLKDYVLQLTVYADKALYLHTIMVRKIGAVILAEIIRTGPHFLDGVCGYSEDYIASHPMELMELWKQSAMFHDIGKYYCIDYVSNSSRNLTDEEFKAIQCHPLQFDSFFGKTPGSQFHCIRSCARNHHIWHNQKGGYPAPEPTIDQPFVDIVSIADSIDAATDIIGRPYTAGKTLDMLIDEFDTFRDTRYSAFVIDILKRPHVKSDINHLIHEGRKHLNFLIYSSKDTGLN